MDHTNPPLPRKPSSCPSIRDGMVSVSVDGEGEYFELTSKHNNKNYPCIMRWNETCHFWCGYAGVDKNNGFYEEAMEHADNAVVAANRNVHGGITFSGYMYAMDNHIPYNLGQYWFFGFDCGHYNDMTKLNPKGIFRDKDFVINNIQNLVDELTGAFEIYLRSKKGGEVPVEDHNKMIALAASGNPHAKEYIKEIKKDN